MRTGSGDLMGWFVPRYALRSACCALVLAIALRASPTAQQASSGSHTTDLPQTAQTEVFVRVCAHCHDLDRIESHRRTKSEWSDTLQQMADAGAEASDEEWATVLDVLLTNFGAVAINHAPAGDLVKVLGVSSMDAENIVSYRSAHGDFPDLAAVKKVPGLDAAAIERRREAIRF